MLMACNLPLRSTALSGCLSRISSVVSSCTIEIFFSPQNGGVAYFFGTCCKKLRMLGYTLVPGAAGAILPALTYSSYFSGCSSLNTAG